MFSNVKARNDRATYREHNEAVQAGALTLAKRIRDANPDLFPRVLVEVRGGVAYVTADGGVHFVVVDYDNEPDAIVPEKFQGLSE